MEKRTYRSNQELADVLAEAIKNTHMDHFYTYAFLCPFCGTALLAHGEAGMGFCPKCGKMRLKEE